MLSFEEALKTLLDSAPCLPAERVNLADSPGRVLAEDVVSDMDMPPFNKSAMDGFACRRADLGNELVVLEMVAAGCAPTRKAFPKFARGWAATMILPCPRIRLISPSCTTSTTVWQSNGRSCGESGGR